MPHGQNASTLCRLPIAENTSTFRVFSISYGEMDLGFCSYCGALLGHHIHATTGCWKEACVIKRNIRYGVRVGIGCAYNVELMLMCFDGHRLHFRMRTAVELTRVLWQGYLYTRYVGRSTYAYMYECLGLGLVLGLSVLLTLMSPTSVTTTVPATYYL